MEELSMLQDSNANVESYSIFIKDQKKGGQFLKLTAVQAE
jgi:hypothetical protein